MEDKKALVEFVQRLVKLSKELPSGSKKPKRGGDAVMQAPMNSAIITKFIEEVDKYDTIDAAAAQKILESVRKKDDQLLKKVKIAGLEEIHHRIGYAEFARVTQNLSLADTIDAMMYLQDQGIELGTSTGNLKHGALSKEAHRPKAADSLGIDAHMGTQGRLVKWNPDVEVPTDFASFKNAWETSVFPQAIAGSSLGILADSGRKVKTIQHLMANPDVVARIAEKNGVTPAQLLETVATRSLNVEEFKADPATTAARQALKELGDISDVAPTRNPAVVTDLLNQVGIKGKELLRIAQNPQAVTNQVFNTKNLAEIPDKLSKLVTPGNLGKLAISGGLLSESLKPGPADAASALSPEVVDKYHTEGWWSGTKQLAINTTKELVGGLPSALTIGGLTTLAPGTAGTVMSVGAPLLGGLAIAGTAQAAGKAYSRHLEHTTGSSLGEHYERYKYVNSPLTNGYKPRPRRTDYEPRPVSGPLQIKQDNRNRVQQWWDSNPLVERVTEATRAFDPNKGDFGVTELTHGRITPADRYENGSTSVRIRPN